MGWMLDWSDFMSAKIKYSVEEYAVSCAKGWIIDCRVLKSDFE